MPGEATLAKLAATEAGFDLCGVSRAVPGEEDAHLAEWLANGYHGVMGYMERRRDVREIVEGCRSVIAVGLNYHVPIQHGEGARISRYAWGGDYHAVMGDRLERYVTRLGELIPGAEFRAYCDTGPVMEKAWAQRAGIGWIGKNGCLISQRYGSWIFLAVVLTTAELAPDAPHPDRCGSCDRCLHACPTDAFVAPGVIDARRCIPYLTIEQWKPIAAELKIAPRGAEDRTVGVRLRRLPGRVPLERQSQGLRDFGIRSAGRAVSAGPAQLGCHARPGVSGDVRRHAAREAGTTRSGTQRARCTARVRHRRRDAGTRSQRRLGPRAGAGERITWAGIG